MNETLLQVPGEFTKLTTMRNNTARLQFDTQEVKPEVLAQMMQNIEKFGWLCFLAGERQIDTLDVVNLPELEPHETQTKSQAERIRSVLFVYWEQIKSPLAFKDFYDKETEKYIDHVKSKLN
jgi:hypothetical protein